MPNARPCTASSSTGCGGATGRPARGGPDRAAGGPRAPHGRGRRAAMNLTLVCSYFPLPADRGDPVRVLMILRALARARPYSLLVVRRPETTPALVEQLRGELPGVRIEDYPASPYRAGR